MSELFVEVSIGLVDYFVYFIDGVYQWCVDEFVLFGGGDVVLMFVVLLLLSFGVCIVIMLKMYV